MEKGRCLAFGDQLSVSSYWILKNKTIASHDWYRSCCFPCPSPSHPQQKEQKQSSSGKVTMLPAGSQTTHWFVGIQKSFTSPVWAPLDQRESFRSRRCDADLSYSSAPFVLWSLSRVNRKERQEIATFFCYNDHFLTWGTFPFLLVCCCWCCFKNRSQFLREYKLFWTLEPFWNACSLHLHDP